MEAMIFEIGFAFGLVEKNNHDDILIASVVRISSDNDYGMGTTSNLVEPDVDALKKSFSALLKISDDQEIIELTRDVYKKWCIKNEEHETKMADEEMQDEEDYEIEPEDMEDQ